MSRVKVSALCILSVVFFAVLLLGSQGTKRAAAQQRKIAFESERDGNLDIYLVNPDGSNLQRLTKGKEAWEPDWSPDRSKILFVSTLHGGEEEVYVMDADGSNVRRLTHTPGEGTSSWSADWSPDGKQIVFQSNRDGSPEGWDGYDLYVMDANGSNVRRLTREHGFDAAPAWSPDGRTIAFMSSRDDKSRSEIYVMTVDGSKAWRLTHDKRQAGRPAWSPDGERITFQSTRTNRKQAYDGDEFEIYVMDADGANIQRLTHRPNADGHPDWSPDGTKIIFTVYGDQEATGNSDEHGIIYVMDADGTNVHQLTFGGRGEGHPDW